MRSKLTLVLALLFALPAVAQNTTVVTGTITDPNGLAYSFASVQIELVPLGITPTIPPPCNGQNITPCSVAAFYNTNADVNGTFSTNLASNAVLTPAGTQWKFTIATPGVPPPLGTGPQKFSTLITISGATQSVSSVLSALAPALSHAAAGTTIGTYTVATLPASPGVNTLAVVTDGTNQSCTVGGGSSRNLCQWNGSSWVFVSPSVLALSSPVISPNPLAFDVNLNFKGPNPYLDVTRYGGYIGPNYNSAATTCSITATQFTATCGSASDFVNGNGILILGAGPAPVIATPQAPTVTTLFQVGTTQRNYCVADRDWAGGLTPCSAVGNTTNAPFSMALASYSISTWSWNQATHTMTLTTASNHNMPTTGSGILSAQYAQVEIPSGSTGNGLCEGAFSLTAVPANNTMQFQRNELGSNPNCSGGTVRIAPRILLKWDSHYSYSVQSASCASNTATVVISPGAAGPNGTWVVPFGVKAVMAGILDSHYNISTAVNPTGTGQTNITFPLNCSGVTNVGAGGTVSLVPGKAVKNQLIYECTGSSGCALPANASSYSLVGVAQGNDGYFTDKGYPMSAATVDAGDAPATAPTSAINEYLDTTIANGGGTTSLTLAASAATTVSGAGAWHDNVPNLLQACAALPANTSGGNGGYIVTPAPTSVFQFFPIIANFDATGTIGQNPRNCPGNVTFNFGPSTWLDGALMPGKGINYQAAAAMGSTSCQATFYTMGPALSCFSGYSYPMVYFEPEQASSNWLANLVFSPNQAYQSGLFIDEQMNGDGTVSLRLDNVHVNGGIYSYPVVDRAGFGHFFNFGGWSNGGGNFSQSTNIQFKPLCGMPTYQPPTVAPLPYIITTTNTYSFGTMEIDNCGLATGNFGTNVVFNNMLTESPAGPAVKVNLTPYGLSQIIFNEGDYADLIGGSATPYLDLTNTTVSSGNFLFMSCATSQQPLFETNSANSYAGIHVTEGPGCNGNIGYPTTGGALFENLVNNIWYWNTMQFQVTGFGKVGAGQISTPSVAPTVTVSTTCTGFPPAGTYTYGIIAWDSSSNQAAGIGGATTVGPASTGVTLNGTTQCANISQPALPIGTAYWGAARLSGPGSIDQVYAGGTTNGINSFLPISTTTITDQTTFTAGSVPNTNTSSLQSLSPGSIAGNLVPLSLIPLTDNSVDVGSALLHFRSLFLNTRTVGTLPPASSSTGNVYIVTDGVNSTDCTTGGGSTLAWCYSNGTTWTSIGGSIGGGPGTGTQFCASSWATTSTLGSVCGFSGQTLVFQNSANPVASSPSFSDSTSSPVSTTPYLIQCDSGALIDRSHSIQLTSGASVVNVPLSTGTGCSGLYAKLINNGAGPVTIQRNAGSTDTFIVTNGTSKVSGATSFTLNNGQSVLLAQSATGIWEATLNISSALSYGAGGGTAQAQTETTTLGPIAPALVVGWEYCWLPAAANTAAGPTLAPDGLAATTIVKVGGAALIANDLTTTAIACGFYDGSHIELQNPQTLSSGGSNSGAPNYGQAFTLATTVTMTGAASGATSKNLVVQCYDNATPANAIAGSWTVDPSSFNVIVTFASQQSGYCVVNSSGPARYQAAFTNQTSLSVPASTHGLGANVFNISLYDTASPQNRIEPAALTIDSSGNVTVKFAVSQSGTIVIE